MTGDAGRLARDLVVLAEGGGQVDDAGAVLGGDEVGGEDAEGVGVVREVREERARSGRPTELGARQARDTTDGIVRRSSRA